MAVVIIQSITLSWPLCFCIVWYVTGGILLLALVFYFLFRWPWANCIISVDLNFLTCEMGIRYLPGLMHWTVRKSIMVFWGYLRFRSEKQICSCVLCGEIFWSKGPWEECWDPYTVTSKGVCVSLSSSDLGHPSHFIDEKLKTQRAEADLLCQAIKVKGSANRRPLYIYANTDGFMGVLFQPLLGRKLSWVSNTLKSVLVWLQVSEF